MLNLLATLVVTALPASPGGLSACPDPTPPSADVAFGECGEVAPLDLWYRVSRFADADPGGVGAGPARRSQANRVASCDAPQTPAQVPSPQAPPAALFALPTLLDIQIPLRFEADAHALPARALAPPERPPRA
ncbi:MAG TPA: hypothetical protein VKQ32_00300 [Polyangia bacterium]|nr:hypothetical protein [Polyangia bacterium]